MKFFIPILILINVSCFAQDTLPIYSHQFLVEKEINCCKSAKNQLKCVDSLIKVNLNTTNYSGKFDPQKAYLNRLRKLCIYHFNAGVISGLRGNIEQSFVYFDRMESYMDTLDINGKTFEFENLKNITRYKKTEFCTQTFYKDTAMFNRCDCKQFFTEYQDEPLEITTGPTYLEKPEIKNSNWGEFYINDTLRINKHFVSDSVSIIYFKKQLRPLILSKLLQNPYYFEMLGDPSMNITRDTLIYKLSAKYEKGKYERNCEIVFATSKKPELFDPILFSINNIELTGYIKKIEIYIPIVVTTEESINTNKVNIDDDHFLMEVIKLKPIKVD